MIFEADTARRRAVGLRNNTAELVTANDNDAEVVPLFTAANDNEVSRPVAIAA